MKQIEMCVIRFISTGTVVQDRRLTENFKYSVLSFVMQAEHVWHVPLCSIIQFEDPKIQTIEENGVWGTSSVLDPGYYLLDIAHY